MRIVTFKLTDFQYYQKKVLILSVRPTTVGETLSIANQNGHYECVQFLSEKGADIECKTDRGLSLLFIVLQNGH